MQNKKSKLSRAILDMKFMKKSKERVEKEVDDAEGQAMYSNEISDEMRKCGNVLFMETGIFQCRDLIEGRLSFGGMNPEVEKLMNGHLQKLEESDQRKEKDVSDVEMTKVYSPLVDTMGKKFHDKKNRNSNKKKFLKPSDD